MINGYGGSRCSATTFGPSPLVIEERRPAGHCVVEIQGRMSGAAYVAVNGFERPRTAPAARIREVEVRAGRIDVLRSGRTPPKRFNPAMARAGRPRRPAGRKRGQVKAAIAQSVLQTLSSFVQGARDVALRRSFSWHS